MKDPVILRRSFAWPMPAKLLWSPGFGRLLFSMELFGLLWILAMNAGVNPIPRDDSFNPQAALVKERPHHPHISLPCYDPADSAVAWDRDRVYLELLSTPFGPRALHLDLVRPTHYHEGLLPVVFLIHGGGWRSGSRSNLYPMAHHLALRGYLAVPVEYRLALEAKYPAALHDIRAAIAWVRSQHQALGIDPARLTLLGCSSGAHLVTLLGMTQSADRNESGNQASQVQAIINVDGVVSFVHEEAIAEREGSSASQWLGARYEDNPKLWRESSPLEHVNDLAPPVMFINSSIPRFHAGRDDLIKRLTEFDIRSRVHTLEATPHPFWLFDPWFDRVVDMVDQCLEDWGVGTE